MFSLAMVAACSTNPHESADLHNRREDAPEITTDACDGDPLCVDVEMLRPHWVPALGHKFEAVWNVGDANGDGLSDVAVGVSNHGMSIVYAPLVRQLVLPDDEDAAVVGLTPMQFTDTDDDGAIDLIADEGYVPGPLSPTVTKEQVTLSWPKWDNGMVDGLYDIDLDGTFDYVHREPGMAEIWRGAPATLGVGTPTATIRFNDCAGDEPENREIPLEVLPDMDGDGAAEICTNGGWVPRDPDCRDYIVPATITGLVEPEHDAGVHIAPCPKAVGDQNGDGVEDFEWEGTVLAGPLTWESNGFTGEPILDLYADFGFGVEPDPLHADLTGDGLADFKLNLALTEVVTSSAEWVILSGGAGGGASTGTVSARFLAQMRHRPEFVIPEASSDWWLYFTDAGDGSVTFVPLDSLSE